MAGAAGGAMTVAAVSTPPLTAVAPVGSATPNMNGSPAAGQPEIAADARTSIYPYWGVGNTFMPGNDLDDEAGNAWGYRFTTSGVNLRAATATLAKQLGLKGDVRSSDGGWSVGADDGTGPSLWVSQDGVAGWSYSDPTRNPWGCPDATTLPGPAGGSESVPASIPCEPAGKPMSRAEAQQRVTGILQAFGVERSEVDWEVGGDDATTWVTAWQVVEGQRTQLSWSFTFDSGGIVYASGHFAAPEKVGPFPTVGAATAVNRSQQVKWLPFGPTAAMDPTMAYPADSAVSSLPEVEGAQPAAATEGKVTINYSPITVTGAEQTITQYWQPDGTLLLLPAYTLTTKGQGIWVVIAVADSAVTFAEAATPIAVPMAEARSQAQADTYRSTLNP